MSKYALKRFNNNADLFHPKCTDSGIPILDPGKWISNLDWIGFNFLKTLSAERKTLCGIHFFIDDYQFERIWTHLELIKNRLTDVAAVMSPDFSEYTDWPIQLQKWNHYRKHYVGAYLQRNGIIVYPTISWSDERSYDWCFDGEPVGATVCVSSVGTQNDKDSKRLFLSGYEAMIDKLKPETVIFYGNIPNEVKGNIVQIKAFTDKFKEAKISDF